eukprot:1267439-Karenia_brevis.AAC.1
MGGALGAGPLCGFGCELDLCGGGGLGGRSAIACVGDTGAHLPLVVTDSTAATLVSGALLGSG